MRAQVRAHEWLGCAMDFELAQKPSWTKALDNDGVEVMPDAPEQCINLLNQARRRPTGEQTGEVELIPRKHGYRVEVDRGRFGVLRCRFHKLTRIGQSVRIADGSVEVLGRLN